MAHIIVGDFDGERFWEPKNTAKLPVLKQSDGRNTAMAMEELQFLFCKEGDILFTRYPMNEELKEYLKQIGFLFHNSSICSSATIDYNHSVMRYLCDEPLEFGEAVTNWKLDPFQINSDTHKAIKTLGLQQTIPDPAIVQMVNSKRYSSNMREQIGCRNIATEIHTAQEVTTSYDHHKKNGNRCLIKEEFGVSGLGNLLLPTDSICKRIEKYIKKQEDQGKEVSFIVEPLLEKAEDFSSQLYIEESGKFHFVCLQKVFNQGFSYKGTISPDEDFIRMLERSNYFEYMEQIANHLYADGYFGCVGVDSMFLKDGTIEPIVEINARKTMSLLKYNAEDFLASHNVAGNLSSISFTASKETCSFHDFMQRLKHENLLFDRNHPSGIIPLSERTMYINKTEETGYKGNLYYIYASNKEEDFDDIIGRLRRLLSDCNFKLV